MTRHECLKSLSVEDFAAFLEGMIAIALGTDDLIDIERRVTWLNGEETWDFMTKTKN